MNRVKLSSAGQRISPAFSFRLAHLRMVPKPRYEGDAMSGDHLRVIYLLARAATAQKPIVNIMSRATLTSSSIFYHIAVLDTVRPFIPPPKQHGFTSYLAHVSSPDAIFAASLKQLKS